MATIHRLLSWPLLAGALILGLAGGSPAAGLGPAPGILVELGGYGLHLDCRGSGRPTVVLEGGLGEPALVWGEVQARLEAGFRVCAYDRGGYGWSDPGPSPRTAAQEVAELRALLERATGSGPYILVGHSYGGYLVQLFAGRYPDLVAGLVLVDSAHPRQVERFREAHPDMPTAPTGRGDLAWIAFPEPPGSLSPRQRSRMRTMLTGSAMRQAVISELLHFRESGYQVLSSRPLPPIPVVVLSRDNPGAGAPGRARRLGRTWMAMQRDLADLTPCSRHRIVSRSGHDIHLDQPDVVAEAVREVAREHRAGKDSPVSPGLPSGG